MKRGLDSIQRRPSENRMDDKDSLYPLI
uniref:Uncharacterized protein n=1 Tax=Rhizophora mucronata TaxID=61149 RepID=A0A2P2PGX5_RHIMU